MIRVVEQQVIPHHYFVKKILYLVDCRSLWNDSRPLHCFIIHFSKKFHSTADCSSVGISFVNFYKVLPNGFGCVCFANIHLKLLQCSFATHVHQMERQKIHRARRWGWPAFLCHTLTTILRRIRLLVLKIPRQVSFTFMIDVSKLVCLHQTNNKHDGKTSTSLCLLALAPTTVGLLFAFLRHTCVHTCSRQTSFDCSKNISQPVLNSGSVPGLYSGQSCSIRPKNMYASTFFFQKLYCLHTQTNRDRLLMDLGPDKTHISTIHDEAIFVHIF